MSEINRFEYVTPASLSLIQVLTASTLNIEGSIIIFRLLTELAVIIIELL
jgi:hypothetical protein